MPLHPAVWVLHLWVPPMDTDSESWESFRVGAPSSKKGLSGPTPSSLGRELLFRSVDAVCEQRHGESSKNVVQALAGDRPSSWWAAHFALEAFEGWGCVFWRPAWCWRRHSLPTQWDTRSFLPLEAFKRPPPQLCSSGSSEENSQHKRCGCDTASACHCGNSLSSRKEGRGTSDVMPWGILIHNKRRCQVD